MLIHLRRQGLSAPATRELTRACRLCAPYSRGTTAGAAAAGRACGDVAPALAVRRCNCSQATPRLSSIQRCGVPCPLNSGVPLVELPQQRSEKYGRIPKVGCCYFESDTLGCAMPRCMLYCRTLSEWTPHLRGMGLSAECVSALRVLILIILAWGFHTKPCLCIIAPSVWNPTDRMRPDSQFSSSVSRIMADSDGKVYLFYSVLNCAGNPLKHHIGD